MRSTSYVCFTCCRAVKRAAFVGSDWRDPKAQPAMAPAPRCPDCAEAMIDVGHRFKAPRKNDRKQWEKVRRIVEAGFTFHGYGRMPRTLAEVDTFVKARTMREQVFGTKRKSPPKRRSKLTKQLTGPTFGPITPIRPRKPAVQRARMQNASAQKSSVFRKPTRKRA